MKNKESIKKMLILDPQQEIDDIYVKIKKALKK